MTPPRGKARLDARSGRGTARRQPWPRPMPRARRRGPIAAAVLVCVLTLGWLVAGRQSAPTALGGDAGRPLAIPAPETTTTAVDSARLRARLAGAESCRDVPAAIPAVRCVVGGLRVDAQLLPTRALLASYEAKSGARPGVRRGPSACASGRTDERSWSRAAAPARPVGRYRCRLEHGRAAIWWTDEHGLLAHAVARDADLARLFAWWRAQPDS